MSDRSNPLAGWTPKQIEEGKRWVEAWKRAGPALDRIRIAELAAADCRVIAARLEDASRAALARRRPTVTSGLVEQQRRFHQRPE